MPEPDSEALVDALSKVERVHLHTLNANPLAPLAAQLAGPDLIVETIENESDPDTCLFTDFSILIGEHLRDLLATPSRTEWVSNGVHCPPNAPELRRLPAPRRQAAPSGGPAAGQTDALHPRRGARDGGA